MKKILLLLFVLISSTVFSQTQVCPDVVCINTQNEDYFVINTPGSTYNWTLSGGGVIASGQGTALIRNLNRTAGASRYIWPAALKNQNLIDNSIERSLQEASAKVNRNLLVVK